MNSRWVLNITCGWLIIINSACQKEKDLPDVEVLGHAGISIYPERAAYPPNTTEAVLYALDVLDADGVEVDVQMTKDSVLVLYHDPYLDGLTRLTGCVAQYDFAALENAEVYGSRYKLARLDDVIALCAERHQKIFLDLKPYHYCASANVDYAAFNNALNSVYDVVADSYRPMITVNTRNAVLLEALTDTLVVKSFETENFDLALNTVAAGTADELCINFSALSSEQAQQLNTHGIPFSIFSVKTTKEIKEAVNLLPRKIISDNIAFTNKVTK